MRLRYVIFYSALLLAILLTALYFYVKSELEYLKIYTPSVDNITSQPKAKHVAIYGANDLLMYKKHYLKSERLPVSYNMKELSPLVDMMIDAKQNNQQHDVGTERWKLYIMDMHDIDPFSLKGVVLSYYADQLLANSKLGGFRAEAVRWYTLDKLNRVYSPYVLYGMLLNSAKYDENVYGIAAAARHFFSKSITECNYLERAFLVAIISGKDKPLNPREEFANIDSIARRYLYNLYEQNIISSDEYQKLRMSGVSLSYENYRTIEPAYVDAVIQQVNADERFNDYSNTLIIKTGYDNDATISARSTIIDYMRDKPEDLQISFVLMNTLTNSVEVAIGSKVETASKNRAITTSRQMASTFKPFVYLTAFTNGVLPTEIIDDKRYTFRVGAYQYKPNNFENNFFGKTLTRKALIHSLNNATIKLAENVGLKNVMDMAINAGMKGNLLPIHPMALGSYPTTPLNVAEMYSTIANMGVKKTPTMILSVEKDGELINMQSEPVRVAPASAAYQVMYIMQDVAKQGTAKSAGLAKGTSIKTGTSNNYVDAWAATIFGEYVAVVWLGYDTFKSMGEAGVGGSMAAPFIAAFQENYFGSDVIFDTIPPDDIVYKRVDFYTGKRTNLKRGTYLEAYDKNNIPEQ